MHKGANYLIDSGGKRPVWSLLGFAREGPKSRPAQVNSCRSREPPLCSRKRAPPGAPFEFQVRSQGHHFLPFFALFFIGLYKHELPKRFPPPPARGSAERPGRDRPAGAAYWAPRHELTREDLFPSLSNAIEQR